MLEETSRSEGFAVTKLFENAYVSYKGRFYRVDSIVDKGQIAEITKEVYNRMRRRLELLESDVGQDFRLPEYPDVRFDSNMSEGELMEEFGKRQKFFNEKMRIKKIGKVICRIDKELDYFYCKNCGWMTKHSTGYEHNFRCMKCGSIMIQAPLFVLWNAPSSTRARPTQEIIRSISMSKCTQCGEWMHLKSENPKQPVSSMKYFCPKCDYQRRLFAPRNYIPAFPAESFKRSISVSTAQIMTEDLKKLSHDGLLSSYIENISYVSEVKIYQITFGYTVGSYGFGVTKRFENGVTFGREFPTEGILIQLKPEFFEICKENMREIFIKDIEEFNKFEKDLNKFPELYEDQLKRWILHSLSHAFLVMLPIKTGLELNKFGYTYDLDTNKVILFDDEFGGLGGCKTLSEDKEIFLDFIALVKRTIERCDCRHRCKKCIVIPRCGEINQALNRHLLGPILDVETYYE